MARGSASSGLTSAIHGRWTARADAFGRGATPLASRRRYHTGAYVRQSVNAQAQATDSGSDVNTLMLTVDGHSLAPTLAPAPPAPSVTAVAIWNTTTFADGTHTLAAAASDRAGNSPVATPVVVIVDNTPPDTQITSGPSSETAFADLPRASL